MRVNAVKIPEVVTALPKKLKRTALIAAVALPTMAATQSCSPWFYNPYYCPPPSHRPYHHPAPPPPPHGTYRHSALPHQQPHHGGPRCDVKSFEEVGKELSEIG